MENESVYVTVLGLLAGALTTFSFVPQLVKAWKTRSTGDLSLSMLTVLCSGIILWIVYGIMIASLPVVIANIITLILGLAILWFKIRYK